MGLNQAPGREGLHEDGERIWVARAMLFCLHCCCQFKLHFVVILGNLAVRGLPASRTGDDHSNSSCCNLGPNVWDDVASLLMLAKTTFLEVAAIESMNMLI